MFPGSSSVYGASTAVPGVSSSTELNGSSVGVSSSVPLDGISLLLIACESNFHSFLFNYRRKHAPQQ